MGFQFRRSKKLGPLRMTATHRGISASGGMRGLRVSKSTTGRTTRTVRPAKGVFWRTTRRR